jgi:hypothetical protein
MTISIRHAWLQKHPSPAATRGEFHWYPPDDDRELRASFVERSRGVDAPAVLWQLAPGRVSWARVFAATAPTDGRRYAGLVLATAEDEAATAAELLEALEVPEAAPWSEAAEPRRAIAAPAPPPAMDHRLARARRWSAREVAADEAQPRRRSDASAAEVAAIARSLLGGGDAVLADPDRAELPRLAASVERWMPPAVAGRPRRGAWRTGPAPQAPDRIAGLIAAAWADPRSRAAQAWGLLCELAEAKERTVDELAGELAAFEQPAAALTDAERAVVGEPRDFAATLHAWGRGRLDGVASAATLPSRLADAVALRVLACLIADGDPRGPIAEARWHALLPAARRAALLDTVVRRAASLRALVEVHDA